MKAANDNSVIFKNADFCDKLELYKNKAEWNYLKFSFENLLQEEFDELGNAINEKDEVETLDGAYDVSVIALNIAYKLFRMKGFSHEEAQKKTEEGFHRVLDSNLSKLHPDGSVKFREDGKVMKPETFKPPFFDDLLKDEA
jgi:predicted HAD superfamily Cof-like phosphohydrolase